MLISNRPIEVTIFFLTPNPIFVYDERYGLV